MTPLISEPNEFSRLSQLNKLINAWDQEYPRRSKGGLLALSGFEHQFLLTLLKIVNRWKKLPENERQDLRTPQNILAEAVSDITESEEDIITITQVKRTLSGTALKKAIEELWDIFNLALKITPDLEEYLRFVISGQMENHQHPEQVIQEWKPTSPEYPQEKLMIFKTRVSCQIIADPKEDLTIELQTLSRDEDAEITIARWLGYLLQLGSGFSPESISTLIWKELIHDRSIETFRATLERLFSLSRQRLCSIRHTLGEEVTLPRAKLSELQASVLEKNITLLLGSSGSGKSALCKLGINQSFGQSYDCLFLNASDILSFTESPEIIANRGLRRLDELLIAQTTQKPTLVVIDDLSDVDDQHFNAVLNLLNNTLTTNVSTNIRFILIAHLDSKHRINERISTQFGNNSVCANVELPQLPIDELLSSKKLPESIISLIKRHQEFGPALNLKLIDYLVRGVQKEQLDISIFKNDLDLLNWFWCNHVQNGQNVSDSGRALIKIAEELANKFTPDLPLYSNNLIGNETLRTLVRRDCLRIMDERIAVTHRFVGDCARFHYLRANYRDIESKHLVERLQNPFWTQPIRWFTLQLASEESEIWQDWMCQALEGEHLQLLDLLLDGAILSKQANSILKEFSEESLPLVIDRLITRLLAIATEPYPFPLGHYQSKSLQTSIAIQEKITGIPKADLWEPIWRWLLSQSLEFVIEKSCIVFRVSEAWLNWSIYTEGFLLRSEVANFTVGLAQRILLPNPNSESTQTKRYYLGDFESNAFSCIVFALRIIPERSAWFLRALVGREIVPANKLEPTQASLSITRPGIGVLEPPHPRGSLGRVNNQFRKFMLREGGLNLDCVVRTDSYLGAELMLALIIEPPHYLYGEDDSYYDDDLGTSGSHDIDVCTFKFMPLLSLLEKDEALGIDIVATLSTVATDYWHKHRWSKGNLEGSLKTDIDGVTLIIDGDKKFFKGGRHALYWHRSNPFCPRILACLLMTLENWLYSRPSKSILENSISLIFKYVDTVAMLGILVSLAKCDSSLLSNFLVPLISSIQLLVWLEFDQIDRGQDYAIDIYGIQKLGEDESQELLLFHKLTYRYVSLLEKILLLWLKKIISLKIASQIIEDWDRHQIKLIPEVSQDRALRLRAWFDHDNWNRVESNDRNPIFQFIGNLPSNPESNSKAELVHENNNQLQNIFSQNVLLYQSCRRILNGEEEKTLELHDQLVIFFKQLLIFLANEEQIELVKDKSVLQRFVSGIWETIDAIFSPPHYALDENAEMELRSIAENLPISISLDQRSRCLEAFIAHVAPRLLRLNQVEGSLLGAIFSCFVGMNNGTTHTFMQSWIKEYGLNHPLTQQIIDIAPIIARFISLAYAFTYAKYIQENTKLDGSCIVHRIPSPEELDYRKYPQIEEGLLSLQKDFIDGKLQQISIIDALEWVPDMLIQEIPNELQHDIIKPSFDWDFLSAALIPVIESEIEDDDTQRFVNSICNQVFLTLISERKSAYVEKKIAEGRMNTGINIDLYTSQSQLLDSLILSNPTNILFQINNSINVLKNFRLIDCILLESIIDILSNYFVNSLSTESNNNSLRNQIAVVIGNYLFELKNHSSSELQTIGKVNDVWKKLIDLLSYESRVATDIVCQDKSLKQFFERFQEVLLHNWWFRRKIYQVSKSTKYKILRRTIFEELTKHPEILPNSRNDEEAEVLVQVFIELWDSDYTWIINSPSRRENLRILLGYLQEIDALGARTLGDRVASDLSNPSV